MIVHWLVLKSFKHQKVTIACVRVIGHHTFDVEGFHRKYGLISKTSCHS